jgi:hypothetical protein
MDEVAPSSFETAARAFLAAHAGLAHAWGQCRSTPPRAGCLRVPARDERGFDLEVHDVATKSRRQRRCGASWARMAAR